MEPVKAPAPLVIISSSPYIHCGSTISAAMRDVFTVTSAGSGRRCLLFSAGRRSALSLPAASRLSSVKRYVKKLMQRPITVGDGSAL